MNRKTANKGTPQELRCLVCTSLIPTPIEWCRCKDSETIVPTPLCQSAGHSGCICSEPELVRRFYCEASDELLDQIEERVKKEYELLERIQQHGTFAITVIDELRAQLMPQDVNELLRFFSRPDLDTLPATILSSGQLPDKRKFYPDDLATLRDRGVYPLKQFEFVDSRIKVIIVAGTTFAIGKLPELNIGGGDHLYIGLAAERYIRQLAQAYEPERDFTPLLKTFTDWQKRVEPDITEFFPTGSRPACKRGNTWIYPQLEGFPEEFSKIREWYGILEKNQKDNDYSVYDTEDGSLVITVIPRRPTEKLLWPRSEEFLRQFLTQIDRGSGIILMFCRRSDLELSKRFIFNQLTRENVKIADLSKVQVVPHHATLGTADFSSVIDRIPQVLDYTRDFPILLWYSGIHPMVHLRQNLASAFIQSVTAHFLMSSFRPVCSCSTVRMPFLIQYGCADKDQVPCDVYKPVGCPKCFGSGYGNLNIALLSYDSRDASENSFLRSELSGFLLETPIDLYYGSKLFGSRLKAKPNG